MVNANKSLSAPSTLLFDWHGTLVNTIDAMFDAMEDMLPQLEELGLLNRLVPEELCKTSEDVKLVRYIRIFRRLHPKILAERRVSRTELFGAIFGDDTEAKKIAHAAYNQCYRRYFGKVHPFQDDVGNYLKALKNLNLKLGVATNRSREFLDYELQLVDEGEWAKIIDTTVCADDVSQYKPDPEVIVSALQTIDEKNDKYCWYVGDSYLDMVTAKAAGVTAVFYNSSCWPQEHMQHLFADVKPDAIVDSLDELFELLENCKASQSFICNVKKQRPKHFCLPPAPVIRIEADWHPAMAKLQLPKVILFDWHATLVDTLDAMYHAVDDMLPEMREKGLLDKLVEPDFSKSPEDARLVAYVHDYSQLHPRIKADRKISRTDIFEVLFGDDQQSKKQAHKLFNKHYRNHYGTVLPFEPQVKKMLEALNKFVATGVITNRDREFFEHELSEVDGTGWTELFSCNVCGDDTPQRKPQPDQLLLAANHLGITELKEIWYVGDSTTDVIAAKNAGVVSVFFNGAQWDLPWLEKIFPGTKNHPFKPDVVVNDFSEFWALVLACRDKQLPSIETLNIEK